MATGSGTKDDPWQLRMPPESSSYTMYRDDASTPPTMVWTTTSLRVPSSGSNLPPLLEALGYAELTMTLATTA